jgi:hypothetical protein
MIKSVTVGHLSIHTMYDDISCEEYIEQLKKVPFLAHWSVKVTYTLQKVEKGEYCIRRIGDDFERQTEIEKWEDILIL